MKIDGSILSLVGSRIFDTQYIGEDADLGKLKHDIVDLITRSWKFYNEFSDAADEKSLTQLEMYGAAELASNSSDISIKLFYKNIFASSMYDDILYRLYFDAYSKMVNDWEVSQDDLDSFKSSIASFQDAHGEKLTKICLLIGIYFVSLDTPYMYIREYAYYNFLDDEKEAEEFRQTSHYRYVINRPAKFDLAISDSYEHMTVDELVNEFARVRTEHVKMIDKIFENT